MARFLSRWLRRIHRWVAVLIILIFLGNLIMKLVKDPQVLAIWGKIAPVSQQLFLIMIITGAYMLALPYYVRAKRNRRIAEVQRMLEEKGIKPTKFTLPEEDEDKKPEDEL